MNNSIEANPLRNARWVDAAAVVRQSRRFDLIFRIELADAWLHGNAKDIRTAEEAYLEMVRARNGFYEREPLRTSPEAFIDDFRRTFASIRAHGFDTVQGPIPLDETGELVNGAHRLAICAALGIPCYVAEVDRKSTGGSEEHAFRRGNIHPAVADWGIRHYLMRFPDGRLAAAWKAVENKPVAAFPDWHAWARQNAGLDLVPYLRLARYRLLASLRRAGRAREKAVSHAREIVCRLSCYRKLAEHWERHPA